MEPIPRLVDANGLADALSVSLRTVYRLVDDGLPFVTVGRATARRVARRFDVEECVAWLREQSAGV